MGDDHPKGIHLPKGGKAGAAAQKFVDKLKAKYGLDNKAYIMNAGIWYDMIRLYALAVEKVGSQDPNAIKAFLEGTSKYDGLVSKYSFSKTNHDGFNIADMAVASTIRGDVFTRERID